MLLRCFFFRVVFCSSWALQLCKDLAKEINTSKTRLDRQVRIISSFPASHDNPYKVFLGEDPLSAQNCKHGKEERWCYQMCQGCPASSGKMYGLRMSTYYECGTSLKSTDNEAVSCITWMRLMWKRIQNSLMSRSNKLKVTKGGKNRSNASVNMEIRPLYVILYSFWEKPFIWNGLLLDGNRQPI